MSARGAAPAAVRGALFAAVLLATAWVAAPVARASCVDGNTLAATPANTAFLLKFSDHYLKLVAARPYWSGFVVLADNPGTDYDTYMFASGTGGSAPYCFSTILGSSLNTGGRTDFVIGDFNHNPLGTYFALGHCFSGTCATPGLPGGVYCWRDGDQVFVNDPPTTVTVGPASYEDQMLHCYDVYLQAGTKYFFHFTNTGPNDIKLCLFRNTFNGVYWAGRNAAEFETANCQTYVAPANGYYGIAVVTDRRYNATTTYSLAVTTDPACQCAPELANDVPVSIDATQTLGFYRATQPYPFWMAIGNRMHGGDWDLYAGPPATNDPSDGCMPTFDTQSVLNPPAADVVIGDFNYGAVLPFTEAVLPKRYAGTSGASIQMDLGLQMLELNGPKVTGSLGPNDVVKSWDIGVNAGEDVHVEVKTFGAAIRALSFERGLGAPLWQSRADAMLETAGTGKYTPVQSGFDAVAVVKDDDLNGSYLIHAGTCTTPTWMTSRSAYSSPANGYFAFAQQDTTWSAACVHSASTDWDLQQFGSASGSAWPDCYGATGALSESNGTTDFIIGDFHHQAPDSEYVHAYQFTSNAVAGSANVMWDAGSGSIVVNAPALAVNLPGTSDQIFCYQVRLQAAVPYTFAFTHSGLADTHLLLFRNPGSTSYWAPRAGAEFSVTGSQPYTAPATGWYGVVVVKDNDDVGSFTLRVSSSVLAVGGPDAPAVTRLAGISPNPARGTMRIAYSKAGDAPASFEVLDTAGRVIARLAETAAGRGSAEVSWDRRDLNGARVPAGLYFVRMSMTGRAVDTRKVALIE